MSRVIAFSCAHICTKQTADYLERPNDYSNVQRLLDIIRSDPPDCVVNLGDWQELLYEPDGLAAYLFPEYAALNALKIAGNHDRNDGISSLEIDGIVYGHGHVGVGKGNNRAEHIANVRRSFRGRHMVHGHTHEPLDGWPLDVGSITFTGTYGEIVDGKGELKHVDRGGSL